MAYSFVSVPLTRDNFQDYYEILMGRHALRYLDAQRKAGRLEPTKLDRITNHALSDGAPK